MNERHIMPLNKCVQTNRMSTYVGTNVQIFKTDNLIPVYTYYIHIKDALIAVPAIKGSNIERNE